MDNLSKKILLVLLTMLWACQVQAAYTPFNTAANGNIGIGSASPGQKLDVQGTVRATAFIGDGSGLIGVSNGWTSSGNNVYETSGGNVGIGTTLLTTAALTVMNGNVGIGTWVPGSTLAVNGSISSNVSGISYFLGNLGIGSTAPGVGLDVQGAGRFSSTVTASNISGTNTGDQTITLTSDVTGSGTGSFATTLASTYKGWSYTSPVIALATITDNVGIGTTTAQTKLAIVSGNVGIGTWTAAGGNLIIKGGGNVGIGSAWPGQALDVQGTVRAMAFVGSGVGLTGITSSQWQTQNSTDVSLASGNVGIGTTFTTTSALTVMNGNVGIGTWVPRSTLDVASGSIYFGPTTNALPLVSITANGNNGLITSVANTPADPTGGISTGALLGFNGSNVNFFGYGLGAIRNSKYDIWEQTGPTNGGGYRWYIGTSEKMTMDFNGNVGIGTITPVGALTVMNGNVGIGTWVPAATLDVNGSFTTRGNTGNTTLNTTGGNVGIGSTAPGATLDVQGNGRFSSTIAASNLSGTNTGDQTITLTSDVTGSGTGSFAATLASTYKGWVYTSPVIALATITDNVGIGTTTAQTKLAIVSGNVGIGTWTAGGGNLIVNGGGNVGIGSAWPGQRLDVNGTIRSISGGFVFPDGTSQTTAASGGGWSTGTGTLYTTTGSNNVGIGTSTPQGGLVVTNGNVGIGTWTTAGGALIIKGGNVGIGIATPSAPLQVYGTSNYVADFWSGASGTPSSIGVGRTANEGYMAIAATGGNYVLGSVAGDLILASSTAGNLDLGTGVSDISQGTTRMTIANGGNVGIGTTTPQAAFVVTNGNVGIGTWTAAEGALVVKGSGNSYISSGNLGIGSSAPGAALDVQGSIRASTGTAGSAVCWKTDKSLGHCTTAVDTSGNCTCV